MDASEMQAQRVHDELGRFPGILRYADRERPDYEGVLQRLRRVLRWRIFLFAVIQVLAVTSAIGSAIEYSSRDSWLSLVQLAVMLLLASWSAWTTAQICTGISGAARQVNALVEIRSRKDRE